MSRNTHTQVYLLNGVSVYPPDGDDASDDLVEMMNYVDLYVDPGESWLVAKAKMKSSPSSRKQTVFINHTWSDNSDPFNTLLQDLHQIEHSPDTTVSEEEAEHNVFKFLFSGSNGQESVDSEYLLLPLLVSLAEKNLSDLGLNSREQLVYSLLLEQGSQLRVSMSGYEAGAVAVRQFVLDWGTTAPLLITQRSRPNYGSTVSQPTLQMKIGSDTNFAPLDDETQQTLETTYNSIKENVTEHIFDLIETGTENLLASSLSPYKKYSDIKELRDYVGNRNLGPSSRLDLHSDEAKQVRGKIDKAEYGVNQDGKPELQIDLSSISAEASSNTEGQKLLNRSQRVELYRRVTSYFDEQLNRLHEDMQARTRRALLKPVERIETEAVSPDDELSTFDQLETQYRMLEAMSDLATEAGDVSPPPSGAEHFSRFKKRLSEMYSNEYLPPDERSEIMDAVTEDIRDTKKEIRTVAGSRVTTLLEKLISDIRDDTASPAERIRRLNELKHILQGRTNNQLIREGDGLLTQDVRERVHRLIGTEMLTDDLRQEITREKVSCLNQHIDDLQTDIKENIESEFDAVFEQLKTTRSTNNEPKRAARLFYFAEKVFEKETASLDTKNTPLEDLRRTVEDLHSKTAISEESRRQLLKDNKEKFTAEREQAETEFKEGLREEFDNKLQSKRVSNTVLEKYKQLMALEDNIRNKTIPKGAQYEPFREILDQVIRSTSKEGTYEIPNRSMQRELRKDFLTKIQRDKEKLRDSIVDAFQDEARIIVEDSPSSQKAFKRLNSLKTVIRRNSRQPNTQSSTELITSDKIDRYINLGLHESLPDGVRDQIRNSFLEIVNELIEESWKDAQQSLFEQYEQAVENQLKPYSDDPISDIEVADSNQRIIENLRKSLDDSRGIDQTRLQGGRDRRLDATELSELSTESESRLSDNHPNDIVAIVSDQLDVGSSRRQEFIQEAESILDDLADEQHRRRSNAIDQAFQREITEITSDDDAKYKSVIASLLLLRDILANPRQYSTSGESGSFQNYFGTESVKNLSKFSEKIEARERERLVEQVENKVDEQLDEWESHVKEVVPSLLSQVYDLSGVSQRSASTAVNYFERELPNPGEYQDGKLQSPNPSKNQKNKLINKAAKIIGEFVETVVNTDESLISDNRIDAVESDLREEIQYLRKRNQANQFLVQMENKAKRKLYVPVVGRFKRGISNARHRLSSGRALAAIVVALVVVLSGIVVFPGAIPSSTDFGGGTNGGGGGGDLASGGSSATVGSVANLTIELQDETRSIHLVGVPGDSTSGVNITLSTDGTEEVSKSISTDESNRFRTNLSIPSTGADVVSLEIKPVPDGETTTFRWRLTTVETSNTSTTISPSPSNTTSPNTNATSPNSTLIFSTESSEINLFRINSSALLF